MEKRLLAIFLVLAVSSVLFMVHGLTGAQIIGGCPEGLVEKMGYCIDPICSTGQVECDLVNNVMKPRDCTCEAIMGNFLCGIVRQEETAVKSPLCIRRGQLKEVCGHYDSKKDVCVPNS